MLLLYVEDLVLGAAEIEGIIWIQSALSAAFEMTDLGALKIILGLEIEPNQTKQQLTIHQ